MIQVHSQSGLCDTVSKEKAGRRGGEGERGERQILRETVALCIWEPDRDILFVKDTLKKGVEN